jgi:hypothetical protein
VTTVLAVEPDPRLAARVRQVVCDMVRAELKIVQSIELAIEALHTAAPDLILLPALVSPTDEARLVDLLRTLPGCSHIEMLITPAFEEEPETVTPRGWRRWGARRAVNSSRGVDERRLFAERLGWSLVRARQQKELVQNAVASAAAEPSQAQSESFEAQTETTALVRVSPATVAGPPETPIGSDLCVPSPSIIRALDKNRRANPRFLASELRGLREARIKFGPQVSLLDVSSGGALIETDTRLQPDSEDVLELVGNLHRAVPFRVVRSQATIVGGSLRYRGACAFAQSIDLADLLETRSAESNPTAAIPLPHETDEVLELLERQLPSLRREHLTQLLNSLRSGRPPATALEREALDLISIALSALKPSIAVSAAEPVINPPAEDNDAARSNIDDAGDPSDRRQHLRVYGPFDGLRLGAIETPVTIRDLSEGGCFVDSLIDTQPGRRLSIGLLVPGEDWITTTGEVVRGQPDFGFAVRFVDMPEDVRKRVARVVASRNRSEATSHEHDLAFVTAR